MQTPQRNHHPLMSSGPGGAARTPLRRLREDPLDAVTRVAGEIGPRRATSLQEARAAAYVDGRLRLAGLHVSADVFRAPASIGWDGVITGLAGAASAALFYWMPLVSVGLTIAILVLAAWRTARPGAPLLARRRESQNVIGTRTRGAGVQRRVVLLAPLDSPPQLGNLGRLLGDGRRPHVGRLAGAALLLALQLAGIMDVQRFWWYTQVIPAALLLALGALDVLVLGRAYSPGAVSYAGALAALIAAAEELARVEQTELWLVALGATWSGDGLRDLQRRYPFERDTTTFVELNGLGSGGLAYVTREGRLVESVVEPRLLQLAATADSTDPLIDAEPRPFAGAATIARLLRRKGWRAMTVICLGNDGQVPYRATAADTPDIASAEVLQRAVRLLVGIVRQIDTGSQQDKVTADRL